MSASINLPARVAVTGFSFSLESSMARVEISYTLHRPDGTMVGQGRMPAAVLSKESLEYLFRATPLIEKDVIKFLGVKLEEEGAPSKDDDETLDSYVNPGSIE